VGEADDPPCSERLEVGRVGRAHGLGGEVAVTFSTNRAERRAPGTELWAGDRRLVVEAIRPHGTRWLVRFVGVTDRDAAESLTGSLLTAQPLGDLPEGEHWAHDLVGAPARDTHGRALGLIVAVEANPANDLLVLDEGALVPVAFIVEVGNGVVIVDPPAGLLD
jgi:16S rRNA processing protein RimM